jgi:putative nucleotidyltransferase with HDIG domain
MLQTRLKAGPLAGFVISLVMAVTLTLIQAADQLVPAWQAKAGQAVATTLRVPFGAPAADVESPQGAALSYRARGVTLPIGTVLDVANPTHRAVLAYESQHRPLKAAGVAGLLVIYLTLGMTLFAYLRKFGQNRLRLVRTQIGVAVLIVLTAVVSKSLLLFTSLSEFWIPAAVLPLWVGASFDRRAALVVNVLSAFALASLLHFDLVLLSAALVSGGAAVLAFRDRKRDRHLVVAGVLGGLAAVTLMSAMMVLLDGDFSVLADLSKGLGSQIIGCIGGGLCSGFLAAGLRAPAERMLGHVPRERLLDLTDVEQPLLQKMASEAPGSWEHARAMANLAEAAAAAIGVDALLTRVGAYYHDLGKTVHAKHFVENLLPGESSPHDGLDPGESAEIIMTHVIQGTQILRDGGIPEPVVEFAYTHHGTQLVEYFWNKCQEQGNPKGLGEAHFRYPGMKPQTKETAILMLVDSIEAASRTIDPPDREKFEVMIARIIFTKLKSGQLDESGLTMADLRTLIKRMADMLVNMHHHRIKYQWQAQQAEQFGVPSQVTRPQGTTPQPARVAAPSAPRLVVDTDKPDPTTERQRQAR